MADRNADPTPEPPDPYRLPRTTVPRRYDLTMEPDLAAFTFVGTCDATVEVTERVDRIVLNAVELDITGASVAFDDGGTIVAARIEMDEGAERATFHFDTPIEPGTRVLHTDFSGILNDKLHGFYRSTFTDTDGVDQTLATTQFEATDARRAFPCWDEPDFKAVFGITMVVEADLAAFSNSAEVSRAPRDDTKHVVRFADTMIMSTYLVAFVVGPLEATAPLDVSGIPLRIVYPRGKGHLTGFALEVGAFCLDFYADYFGVPYPGDKVDLVAVPDFAFGAMENLGCITFREALLLVEPSEVTQPELQNVTDVIAHELAHMWFGDLVTMRWWNGIWLNEAFATFMEMAATDAFRPEWDRWSSFGLGRTMAFDTDALGTTRPIEFAVVSPAEAEGMFDVLTYEKGAAVVRMLEQYLGPNRFREGIRRYISTHAYANTETTDLWDAIDSVADEPVRRIMDAWIFQGGYPLVTVDLVHDGGTLRFGQQPFAYAGDSGSGDPGNELALEARSWPIPLIFTQGAGEVVTVERQLLESDGLEVPLIEPIEWVLANTEGTGFYRAAYAPDLRSALVARAQSALSPIERYGLVDDAWAAVLADRMGAVEFLEMAEAFDDETDLSVWQRLVGSLGWLDRLVQGGAADALAARIGLLVRPAALRLGFTPAGGESDRDRELRGVLIEGLGVLARDPVIRAEAHALVSLGQGTPASDPSVLAASISVVAASGDAADFELFLQRFRSAATPQEELRYLYALAGFDDPALMDRLTAMTLTDEIRSQNAPYVLARAMANRTLGPSAWTFVCERWEEVNERFPTNSIVRMLGGIRSLSDPVVARQVHDFFESHEVPQGDMQLAQHLERLEVNVALRVRESEALTHHLGDTPRP